MLDLNDIIHYDYKPSDFVVLEGENGSIKLKIVDFGISELIFSV